MSATARPLLPVIARACFAAPVPFPRAPCQPFLAIMCGLPSSRADGARPRPRSLRRYDDGDMKWHRMWTESYRFIDHMKTHAIEDGGDDDDDSGDDVPLSTIAPPVQRPPSVPPSVLPSVPPPTVAASSSKPAPATSPGDGDDVAVAVAKKGGVAAPSSGGAGSGKAAAASSSSRVPAASAAAAATQGAEKRMEAQADKEALAEKVRSLLGKTSSSSSSSSRARQPKDREGAAAKPGVAGVRPPKRSAAEAAQRAIGETLEGVIEIALELEEMIPMEVVNEHFGANVRK